LSDVHDVFHVSQLKKCLRVPEEQVPMEDLDAKEDLSYQEYPVKILETSERVTLKTFEGRVSKFLFRSVRISRMRFILRGVGL
jgi:hypothetical protein